MSETDQKELVRLLKKLKPGYYPLEVFTEFCRLWTTACVEIIPYTKLEGKGIRVLLIQRPANDKYWPNQYHTPGCVIRPTDTLQNVQNRIVEDELGGVRFKTPPTFFSFSVAQNCRGNGLHLIYVAHIDENIKVGKLFSPNNLPKNLVKIQKEWINQMIKKIGVTGLEPAASTSQT